MTINLEVYQINVQIKSRDKFDQPMLAKLQLYTGCSKNMYIRSNICTMPVYALPLFYTTAHLYSWLIHECYDIPSKCILLWHHLIVSHHIISHHPPDSMGTGQHNCFWHILVLLTLRIPVFNTLYPPVKTQQKDNKIGCLKYKIGCPNDTQTSGCLRLCVWENILKKHTTKSWYEGNSAKTP